MKHLLLALMTCTCITLSAQNVGIGEVSPASKLSVKGSLSVGSGYSTTAAPTNGVIIQGNVGIGTSSPSSALQISGKTITTTFQMTSGGTAGYLLQSDATGNATWVNPATTGVTSISSASPLTTNTSAVGAVTVNLTGIVPSANGGTGVNNAGTITNASNTTITGGGTLGLGGFNLTVPAAGTAALGTGTNNYNAYWSGTNTLAAEQYTATSRGGMGANISAAAIGAIPYATSTTAYGTLPAVATGSVLVSAGTGTAPTWSTGTGLFIQNQTAAVQTAGFNINGNGTVGGTLSLTPMTTGSVLFAAASGVVSQSNANFFWDNTNSRLGLGTTAPAQRLHARLDGDGLGVMAIDNATSGGFAGTYFYQGGSANYRGHIGYVNTGGASSFGGKGTLQLASGNRPLVFSATNGTELFNEVARFDNTTGNLGLGTTTPGASLEIGGTPNNAFRTAYLNISANNAVVTDRPYFRGLNNHLVIAPGTTAGASTMYLAYPGDLVTGNTVTTRIQESVIISATGSGGSGTVSVTNLAGTGNRPVYANASGTLKAASDNSLWVLSSNIASSEDDLGGTVLSADGDDDNTYHITLPFSVTIEGVSYGFLAVNVNGWASFETSSGQVITTTYTEAALPTSAFSNPTVFAYWDDLKDYGSGEALRSQTFGTSPNRTQVIDWKLRAVSGTVYNVFFQLEIHEGSNMINVKYHGMDPNYCGQSATIGFQLAGGASAKAYPITFDGKVLDDNAVKAEGWSVTPVR